MRESRYDSLLKIAKIRVALLLLSPSLAVHQSRVSLGGDASPIKAASLLLDTRQLTTLQAHCLLPLVWT